MKWYIGIDRSVIPTQTCLNRFKADFLLHRGSFTMILRPTPELRSPQADTVELTAKVKKLIVAFKYSFPGALVFGFSEIKNYFCYGK